MGGEGRDFNEGEGREGEVREDLLIIYMFGSKDVRGREKRDFNRKYVWFTRGGEIKLNYFFILIILQESHNFKIIHFINNN
jgi:hypothetical protein